MLIRSDSSTAAGNLHRRNRTPADPTNNTRATRPSNCAILVLQANPALLASGFGRTIYLSRRTHCNLRQSFAKRGIRLTQFEQPARFWSQDRPSSPHRACIARTPQSNTIRSLCLVPDRRNIQVVSHGPSCLDGVMAAAAIKRFFADERVITMLAANGDSDRVIQNLRAKGGDDEIWITDLSWNSTKTAEHLTNLVRNGARLYWIDHHRTAVARASAPEFDVPFTGRLLSEEFSAARLAFNYLKDLAQERGDSRASPSSRSSSRSSRSPTTTTVGFHQVPESADWALAVQTLGGVDSFREIAKLTEPVMSRRMRLALEAGKKAMNKSLELANATMVERPLGNGLRIRTACCKVTAARSPQGFTKASRIPSSRCSICAASASACAAASIAMLTSPPWRISSVAADTPRPPASRSPRPSAHLPSASPKSSATASNAIPEVLLANSPQDRIIDLRWTFFARTGTISRQGAGLPPR